MAKKITLGKVGGNPFATAKKARDFLRKSGVQGTLTQTPDGRYLIQAEAGSVPDHMASRAFNPNASPMAHVPFMKDYQEKKRAVEEGLINPDEDLDDLARHDARMERQAQPEPAQAPVSPPKRRGRPPKAKVAPDAEETSTGSPEPPQAPVQPPRRRGRPPKPKPDEPEPPKRGRGRPRKQPVEEPTTPKRGRGRPRKTPPPPPPPPPPPSAAMTEDEVDLALNDPNYIMENYDQGTLAEMIRSRSYSEEQTTTMKEVYTTMRVEADKAAFSDSEAARVAGEVERQKKRDTAYDSRLRDMLSFQEELSMFEAVEKGLEASSAKIESRNKDLLKVEVSKARAASQAETIASNQENNIRLAKYRQDQEAELRRLADVEYGKRAEDLVAFQGDLSMFEAVEKGLAESNAKIATRDRDLEKVEISKARAAERAETTASNQENNIRLAKYRQDQADEQKRLADVRYDKNAKEAYAFQKERSEFETVEAALAVSNEGIEKRRSDLEKLGISKSRAAAKEEQRISDQENNIRLAKFRQDQADLKKALEQAAKDEEAQQKFFSDEQARYDASWSASNATPMDELRGRFLSQMDKNRQAENRQVELGRAKSASFFEKEQARYEASFNKTQANPIEQLRIKMLSRMKADQLPDDYDSPEALQDALRGTSFSEVEKVQATIRRRTKDNAQEQAEKAAAALDKLAEAAEKAAEAEAKRVAKRGLEVSRQMGYDPNVSGSDIPSILMNSPVGKILSAGAVVAKVGLEATMKLTEAMSDNAARELAGGAQAGLSRSHYADAIKDLGIGREAGNRVIQGVSSATQSVLQSPDAISGMLERMATANALSGGTGLNIQGIAQSLLKGDDEGVRNLLFQYAQQNKANPMAVSAVTGVFGAQDLVYAKSGGDKSNAAIREEYTNTAFYERMKMEAAAADALGGNFTEAVYGATDALKGLAGVGVDTAKDAVDETSKFISTDVKTPKSVQRLGRALSDDPNAHWTGPVIDWMNNLFKSKPEAVVSNSNTEVLSEVLRNNQLRNNTPYQTPEKVEVMVTGHLTTDKGTTIPLIQQSQRVTSRTSR